MNRCGVLLLAAMTLVGCSREESKPAAEPTALPVVCASNYPIFYFAQRIGGEHVEVVLPVPADVDPMFWRPEAEAIRAFHQADLILLNGATYEKWAPVVSLPTARVVETATSFKDSWLEIAGAVTHSHGPGGEHAHAGIDPTTWLDPTLATLQAESVRDALARLVPAGKASFDKQFDAIAAELAAIDATQREITAAAPATPVLASHPVFAYLARRYDLNMRSVHWETDEMPGADAIAELEQTLTDHPARWMIWEGTPDPEIVALLDARGISSVTYFTLGNVPENGGDFIRVMRENAERLRPVFAP